MKNECIYCGDPCEGEVCSQCAGIDWEFKKWWLSEIKEKFKDEFFEDVNQII